MYISFLNLKSGSIRKEVEALAEHFTNRAEFSDTVERFQDDHFPSMELRQHRTNRGARLA